jgi:hypothetical protein
MYVFNPAPPNIKVLPNPPTNVLDPRPPTKEELALTANSELLFPNALTTEARSGLLTKILLFA